MGQRRGDDKMDLLFHACAAGVIELDEEERGKRKGKKKWKEEKKARRKRRKRRKGNTDFINSISSG